MLIPQWPWTKAVTLFLKKSFLVHHWFTSGVTIAKELNQKTILNMGAKLVSEVASKSPTILLVADNHCNCLDQAIVRETVSVVSWNAVTCCRSLEERAIPVSSRKLQNSLPYPLALKSRWIHLWSQGKVGEDGVITIEESRGMETQN